ncbi:MAG: hypothetical protein FJ265_15455 [Planctomycetes bacterium]|nr:hypothetical protein [Planctomycetota bacterium]
MRNFLNEVLVQLRGIWSRLDGGQRLVVAAVLAATVVGLGGIVWYAGRPSYEAVFKASTQDDIDKMQRALQQAGVAYVVADDGMTFTVERSKVGVALMARNKAGLTGRAEASVGGTSTLMDDADTKAWKLAQANCTAAENAILGLEGVVRAKVAASRPRRAAAFRDRDRENRPSATVTVQLQPGTVFLDVAKAAANLTASQLMVPIENVLVVSHTGAQTWRFDPDREAGGGSAEFLAMQRRLGDQKAALAQERLDQLWPGQTSVAVTVELDPTWEITSQKVMLEEPIVSSEKTSKDSNEKVQGRAPDGAAGEPANKDKQSNETKDRTFVTDIGEKRTGKLAPEIRRMTVAVLYDKKLEKVEGFDKQALEKTVKAIVGWDKRRDGEDDFSSLASDFQPVDRAADLSSGPGFGELALRWGPTLGQILGVVVVVLFLKGLFKRGGRAAAAEPAAAPAAAKPPSPDELQRQLRREIERSIAADPATLAKLLESWLAEQKA